MTRGFVTLATGNIKYYKMALNMLKSFRLHNPEAKMAIVCDQKNEITSCFDDVILLESANGDYRDKFTLLVKAPYDENIFIEPDCLIYRNLDIFWEMLSKDSDFSCFGWNNGGIKCWFKSAEAQQHLLDLMPEIQNIDDAPLFNPGYFFIRRSDACKKMFDDCIKISKAVSEDDFLNSYPPIHVNGKLRDDEIFNIAMHINGFICNEKPEKGKCIFLPSKYTINQIDMCKGILNVTDKTGKEFKECSLLHFSTRRANEEGLYLWQKTITDCLYKKPNSVWAKILNNSFFEYLFAAFRYVKTRLKLLIKMVKNKFFNAKVMH